MHRSARLASPLQNRSVQAARARATLHMLHTQRLSRSPQTVPINAEAADQTCWSAACAYARRREKRLYLVAGETSEPGTPRLRGQRPPARPRPPLAAKPRTGSDPLRSNPLPIFGASRGDGQPVGVVHVVRDSMLRAARKVHAPRAITVDSGLLRSIENADRAASIGKSPGRRLGGNHLAKVRVAGSNPVVRSEGRSPGSTGCEGSNIGSLPLERQS
jgi:hypothetical protein